MEPVTPNERISAPSGVLEKFGLLMGYAVRWIAGALLILLLILVVVETADLALFLVQGLTVMPRQRIEVSQVLVILGQFLVVLIMIELLYVIRLDMQGRQFEAETILHAGLVAIARKVIVFDTEKSDASLMFALAALVLALSTAIVILRRFPRRELSGGGE
jgi:uncharacterized membrane protein (DUF373 family)